jgi:hypothetical protein
MSEFIKLTESLSRGDAKRLLLRKSQISHVQEGANGNDTHIRMIAGNANPDARHTYYFVKESIDQIIAMLGE